MPRTVEIMQAGTHTSSQDVILTLLHVQSYGLAERFLKESEHVWKAVRRSFGNTVHA